MNVFDFAIEMEDNGYAYYTELAKNASIPGLKTIFSDLAADEQKHSAVFHALREGAKEGFMAASTSLETAQNVFKLLPRDEQGLKDINDVLTAYQHAMKLEAESHRFYIDAAGKEDDPEVRALLQRIAAEEQDHFNILENVYNFVNAPNQSLEWGEFSNISEFYQYGRDTGQ